MARRDDERCAQVPDGGFYFFTSCKQCVQPQLEQIGWISHPDRTLQIGARENHADDLRSRRLRHQERTTWRSSIRSRYFAIRSNSRLTRSSARAVSRFVCDFVYGMIQTAKLSSDTSATVRLIPLTAIEPLQAT